MKKLLGIILILVLSLSLAACGKETGKTEDAPPTGPSVSAKSEPALAEDDAPLTREDPAETDPSAGAPALSDGTAADVSTMTEAMNKNNMTAEQLAQLEADAAANGYTYEWADDGSLIIHQGDMTILLEGGWPGNDYTKLVPAPSGVRVVTTTEEDGTFTAIVTWDSHDDAVSYAKNLKAKGFDKDVTEMDMNGMFVFQGNNGKNMVTIMQGSGDLDAIGIGPIE